MRIVLPLLVLLALPLSGEPQDAPKETLLDRVRRGDGPIELISASPLFDVMSLQQLVAKSDLIVRGVLGEPRTYVSDDGQSIYTDFPLTPTDFIYSPSVQTSAKPSLAPSIVITLLGGNVVLEGRPVSWVHKATPILRRGNEGIFLLTRRQGKMFLVFNYLGAFDIDSDVATPASRLAGLPKSVGEKPVSTMRTEIVEALKKLGRSM
jgi:hypothetical protein